MTILRKFFPRIEIKNGGKEEAWAVQSNGHNSAFGGIWVWSDIDCMAAVLAQEVYEFKHTWKWIAIGTFVAGGLIAGGCYLLTLPLQAAFLGAIVGLAMPAFKPRRQMELISHAIETEVAVTLYGEDRATYLEREAMALGSYDWTRKLTMEQRIAGMKKYEGKARSWVNNNMKLIRKAFEL